MGSGPGAEQMWERDPLPGPLLLAHLLIPQGSVERSLCRRPSLSPRLVCGVRGVSTVLTLALLCDTQGKCLDPLASC